MRLAAGRARARGLVTGYRYHNYKALIRTMRALIEISPQSILEPRNRSINSTPTEQSEILIAA